MPQRSHSLRWLVAVGSSLVPLIILFIYVDSYAQNVPYLDQWKHSVHIALSADAGTAGLDDIFRPFFAHINAFSNLEIIIATWFTEWNVRAWTAVNLLLGIGVWGLAAMLFHTHLPQYTPLAMPLFALLIFSTAGGTSWTVSFYAFWHLNHALLFGLLLWLHRRDKSWMTIIGATGIVTSMTFTVAPGIVMWIVTPLLLGLLGYRQRSYYIFWIIAAVLVIGVYVARVGVGTSGEIASENAIVQLQGMRRMLLFFFGYLGNLHAQWAPQTRIVIGAAGLMLLLLNLGWLLSHRRRVTEAASWIGLAGYVIAAIGLKSLGRTYLPDWWVPSATLVWVAISALTLINLYDLRTNPPHRYRQRRLKLTTHYISLIAIIGLFVSANLSQWHFMHHFFYPVQFPRTDYSHIETCALQYFFSRDYSCHGPEVDKWHWGLEYPDEFTAVADRQLTIFADIQPQPITDSDADIPVYVHHSLPDTRRVQQFLFPTVADAQIMSLAADDPAPLPDVLWLVSQRDTPLPADLARYDITEIIPRYGIILRRLQRIPSANP